MYELGIEGATVVTHHGRLRANVYVSAGEIVEVSGDTRAADRRVQADGLYLMPGMVDAHVHFMDPGSTEREDFPTGSAAALRAGVTTLLEHTHSQPIRTARELDDKAAYLAGRSYVDFGLGAHAWPGQAADVREVWEAGASFIKAFTCTTHGVPGHDSAQLLKLFETAAEIGGICLLHCEDEALTAAAEQELRASGRLDGGILPVWRSREAELTATTVASLLARMARVRAVIAHVSNAVLATALDGERRATGLHVETCPQYLALLEQEVIELGAFRKFTPPARARSSAELDAMWAAVAAGLVDYVSTDHAPATREQKAAGSIWDVHFGLPGVDTTLPFLLDAAHSGRISYEQVAALYAFQPARLYGLKGKGRIAVGADADLVLIDPQERWAVSDQDILSKAGWSPYAGRSFVGRAVQTYVRGELGMDSGKIVADCGRGRYLRGSGWRG
ncbi:MAG: dihydroorotase family protein [Candidatus Dormibacteraeota bacterium]|nr:dihydroorotase family protein [Candidatus Dormibacteraeota bacterium]